MTKQPVTIAPDLPANVTAVVETIAAAGGRPILIGGAVRDRLLGLPVKDIDIEVYGLPLDALTAALQAIAKVHAVGKSFGILKVNYGGTEIDVSLPRRERKAGQGHRGFAIQSDPYMPFQEAASRRDFTINAIGIDLIDNVLLDPWHGATDLRQGIIRHITDAFADDPLRVLRASQFAARFEFSIAPETLAKCRALQSELHCLSRERIWEELKKLLLKSRRPSLGVTALADTGAIALFPGFASLHAKHRAPWEKHNLILDSLAGICRAQQLPDAEHLTLLFAGLCLRFTTLADAQQALTDFLRQCGSPLNLLKTVPALVMHAERPFVLWRQYCEGGAIDGAIRRLALHAPLRQLAMLAAAQADVDRAPEAAEWLLAAAIRLGVADDAPQPLLLGRHLLALGLQPGAAFKTILDAAFEAQLDGVFTNEAQAMEWLQRHITRMPAYHHS